MSIGIYKITNKLDGKIYIGQSVDLERRINEHKQKRTMTIDEYINVLGVEHFDFEVIETCSIEELDSREQYFISKYNSKEKGYNLTIGGSNSEGENNGRAKMTENDVRIIRQAYADHKKQKDIYSQFQDKITWNQFQAIWQGNSWSHIMPEVFTPENKEWYRRKNSLGENGSSAVFTNAEVLEFRKQYVTKTAKELYDLYNLQSKITYSSFQKILWGESYKIDIPVYKKSKKQWFLNGEPVSTISVSGE